MTDYRQFKPASCERCTLYSAPGPVPPERGSNSRLIYIGQNPGQEEGDAMRPFVGTSGKLLNYQLYRAELPRNWLYITNQVKCCTPGNRRPTEHEIACCQPILASELAKLPTTTHDTVILAGETATAANIGNHFTIHPDYAAHTKPVPFMARIGCVEQKDGRKWIATIHPAFVLRMPDYKDLAIQHLAKAKRLAGIDIPLCKVETTDDALANHIAAVSTYRMFADDVETERRDVDSEEDYVPNDAWALTMCGFSAIPYEAVVVPKEKISLWTPFSDPNAIRCEHNGSYDAFYINQHIPRTVQHARLFDTMLAYHYLFSNAKDKALKPYTVGTFTNLPYYDRTLDRVDPTYYCGVDNIATLLAAMRQIPMLKAEGLLDLFLTVGMPMREIADMWRQRGCRIDFDRYIKFHMYLTSVVEDYESELVNYIGDTNINSSQQLQQLFYADWKLPKQFKREKKSNERRLTTDDDARERLIAWIKANPTREAKHWDALRALSLMGELKTTHKLLEYFTRIDPVDLKLHPYFKLHGQALFRMSSVPNVQNLPKWSVDNKSPSDPTALGSIRSLIIPDTPDDLFADVDLAQCQLWMYAVQFNIKYLLDIYERDEYLYGVVFEDLHERPFFTPGAPKTKANKLKSITAQELREVKEIPLGFLFGRTGAAVAEANQWPREKGVRYEKWWRSKVPELYRAHDAIMFEARQKGRLRPPPGALIHQPNPSLQALNCAAQTPEAFKIQEDIILMERAYADLPFPARTVLSVHDSVLTNIGGGRLHPARVVQCVEDIIIPTLTRPMPWLKDFRFRCDVEVGAAWDWGMTEYYTWKKEQGL